MSAADDASVSIERASTRHVLFVPDECSAGIFRLEPSDRVAAIARALVRDFPEKEGWRSEIEPATVAVRFERPPFEGFRLAIEACEVEPDPESGADVWAVTLHYSAVSPFWRRLVGSTFRGVILRASIALALAFIVAQATGRGNPMPFVGALLSTLIVVPLVVTIVASVVERRRTGGRRNPCATDAVRLRVLATAAEVVGSPWVPPVSDDDADDDADDAGG